MRYKRTQTTVYWALALFLFLLFGCTQVKLVADYDKEVLADTFDLARRVDFFWANYIEATGEQRGYDTIKNEIIAIEVEMNSLLLKNEARDQNSQTTSQVKNVIAIWAGITELFRSQGHISNTSAKVYRRQLSDAFKYIVTGEKSKDISKNNQ